MSQGLFKVTPLADIYSSCPELAEEVGVEYPLQEG